ncbi:diacylglycerol/lipid kinase family protein [Rhizobium sp. CAU 1783]
MNIAIIRNPVSGGRSGARLWHGIDPLLATYLPGAVVRETSTGGEAGPLAVELVKKGFDWIIAVGGDGTIGEVVDGIMRSSRPDTLFSFLPTGTGCDFARNFALPHEPDALLRRIAEAAPRRIDVARIRAPLADGQALERHFVNIASAGVSGEIVRAVNNRERRLANGSARFLLASIAGILRYRAQGARVVVDGEEVFAGPVTVAAIANGAWFGGGMHVVPFADLADGMLDVGVLHGAGRIGVLGILARLYSASHVGHPLISFHKGRSIEIEPLPGEALSVEADGEAIAYRRLSVEVLPAALSLKI